MSYLMDLQYSISQVMQEVDRFLGFKVRLVADHLQQGLVQLQTLVYAAQGHVLEEFFEGRPTDVTHVPLIWYG